MNKLNYLAAGLVSLTTFVCPAYATTVYIAEAPTEWILESYSAQGVTLWKHHQSALTDYFCYHPQRALLSTTDCTRR
jgi:hypothetical protein